MICWGGQKKKKKLNLVAETCLEKSKWDVKSIPKISQKRDMSSPVLGNNHSKFEVELKLEIFWKIAGEWPKVSQTLPLIVPHPIVPNLENY